MCHESYTGTYKQSTLYFMFDIDERTISLVTFVLTASVTLLVLIVSLVLLRVLRYNAKENAKTSTGTSTHCGHCGNGIPNDPVRAISLGAASYMVYNCPKCQGETLLPTQ